jgi:hypothetical protein
MWCSPSCYSVLHNQYKSSRKRRCLKTRDSKSSQNPETAWLISSDSWNCMCLRMLQEEMLNWYLYVLIVSTGW